MLCGLNIFQNVKMNSTVQIYNKIAGKYARSFNGSPEERSIILEFIKRIGKNAKVFDIGCGNSDYFDLFDSSGIRYTGIDISEEMIKIAQKTHAKGTFIVQDMNSIKIEQDAVDGVFCFFSLIHLSEERAAVFLKKIYRSIKSGGQLLLGLQEGEGELFIESPFLPGEKMFMNLYSEDKIQGILQKCGFTIEIFFRKPPTSEKQLPFNKIYILASK